MIEELKNKEEVEQILRSYFTTYKVTKDPFEKIFVYKREDIIGIISYSIMYERAEINYIAVDSLSRRQGIGSKLLKYALDDIKNIGCESISLEVLEGNVSAINLYLKNGFVKKAIREKYYGNKNAILMIKDLR